MRGGRNFATSTSSSGFSRTSTTASTPQVVSVRVNRKRATSPSIGSDFHTMSDLYYRAVVEPSGDCWDMLATFSDCHLVGKGSYGEVARASSSLRDHPLVAVKRVDILEDNHSSDWENGLRLLREIFFLRNLKHPNLIPLISVFPNNPLGASFSSVCIVTPFFKEGSLSSYEPRSLKEILGIQLRVMNGLKFLHSNKIIHRDIKRENIFIHKSSAAVPKVVIGDFGLSRSARPGMTSEVVTKPYRCPSLLLGETNYGPEVDVFAAGIVLLEMLSGKVNATLLPNRKMGLKNFLRFQVALTSLSRLGDRMRSLATKMHVDLEELANDVELGTDFDDKLASEWGKQVWSCIADIYSPGEEVLAMAKGMVAFDPTGRLSVDDVMSNCVFDGVKKQLEVVASVGTDSTYVAENYDEEISRLESDDAKAAAVKAAIWELVLSDPLIGEHTKGKSVSQVFFQELDDQPVSKRTRLQLLGKQL